MFEYLASVLDKTQEVIFPYLEVLFFIILFLVVSRITLVFIRRKLIKKAKNKRQVSDIKIFTRIINVCIFIVVAAIAFFAYIKSISGLGIFVGLITAALGFALQKPITGLAAWIMVVVKRPFHIGDRVKIGDAKGEIYDITLTHVYIDETGGLIDTEQHSGRHIMIPNYKLFEQDIINYTLINDKIIGEVEVMITFESNLKKALNLTEKILNKFSKEYADEIKKNCRVRISFKENGVQIRGLFYAPVAKINEIKNDISIELYHAISKEKDIDFAYPRTMMLSKNKHLTDN
ncbi:MAG TPA: mechanosensitive ion channel family protein [Candidatus Nanoarchaeia archaeon]|nr:mechanosensitive ion channel family protein [Candidatus Nanoarchaeia archaeon]